MNYKSIACPEFPPQPYVKRKKLTVPNQSMSLQEILQRFTRGEPLPIGNEVSFHESDDDLEKVKTMDLVDRETYVDHLKQTQKDFEKQERRRSEKIQRDAVEKAKKELQEEQKQAANLPPKAE